jgi:GNAT superfamily N-acetyltransferase
MIRPLEELSMNALPSLQTILYDGWVLRSSDGYTKRANSVNPIYPGQINMEEKIQFCENHYHKMGLPVVFKITPDSHPEMLDRFLEKKGYRKDSVTQVQILESINPEPLTSPEVQLCEDLKEDWLAAFIKMTQVSAKNQAALIQMLNLMVPVKCTALIKSNDDIISCGLGVYQNGFLGLFDIVTLPEYRKRGFARQIINSLLAWGSSKNTHTIYLQVVENNLPALNLYQKLGFRKLYSYWYRIKA